MERLINRFDYDGDYGTLLNRFQIRAAINFRLTVHGTAGQTRASFIYTTRCAVSSSPSIIGPRAVTADAFSTR